MNRTGFFLNTVSQWFSTSDYLVIDKRSFGARIQERTVCLLPEFYRDVLPRQVTYWDFVGARVAAASPPAPVVFSADGWQSLVRTPSLPAPGAIFFWRSFAIESRVTPLPAPPATLFTAIHCSSHRGSDGSFSIVPEFPTLFLNASYSVARVLRSLRLEMSSRHTVCTLGACSRTVCRSDFPGRSLRLGACS